MTPPVLSDVPKASYTPPRVERLGSFDASTITGSVIGLPIGPRDFLNDPNSSDDLF